MDLNKQQDMVQNQKEVLLATKQQLEALLEDRTRKLEEQNKGISKYAFLNSHKVRSPLARILGLVNLTQYEDLNDDDTRTYYFNELKTNATDLDDVLKEISEILNSDLEK
jgi:light-regulated signal transduction histidine kinase (bacteriophytochrome)